MDKYRDLIITMLKALDESVNDDIRYEAEFLAKTIKGIAEHLKDVEVIGYATLVESTAKRLIDQEDDIFEMMGTHEDEFGWGGKNFEEHETRSEEIRQLCIKVIYKDKSLIPDMSDFKRILDQNKELLTSTNRYQRLNKYLSEDTVNNKIYTKIKSQLQSQYSNLSEEMPTEDTIKDLYPSHLKEIHRLANNHVKSEIEKARYEVQKEQT